MPAPLLAMAAAAGAQQANTGMGLLWQGLANKQQLKQAGKLQNLEIQGNKEMGQYNQGLALDMWDKTNYNAQRQQMEKAGLNVGLMYGSGGGSGGTTSTPTGSVSGQQANSSGGMGMAQQNLALTAAQIELMRAQTEKTKVEAVKTAGIDTQLGQAQVENVKMLTQNEDVRNDILHYEKQIKGIERTIADATTESVINQIHTEGVKLYQEARSAMVQANVDEATQQQQIQAIRQNVTEQQIRMALMKENINLNQEQQAEIKTKIWKMVQDNAQNWERLSQSEREVIIKESLGEFATNTPAAIAQWTKIMNDVTRSYRDLTGGQGASYNQGE